MANKAKIYEFDGFSGTLKQWSVRTGVSVRTLQKRIYAGKPLKEVFHPGSLRGEKGECLHYSCKALTRLVGGEYCKHHEYMLRKYGSVGARRRNITREKEYPVWQNMMGSGLEVEWPDYKSFRRDMGRKKDGQVICRRDWSLGYNKENCFWGTRSESRHGRKLHYDGRDLGIREWSKITGISVATLNYRINAGWPVEKILNYKRKV